LLSHVVTCFWLIMARFVQDDNEGSWAKSTMTPDQLYGDHYTKYVIALYWTLQTITTVGYGDTPIINNYERMFAQLIMLVGVILFSAVNGTLISILESLKDHSDKEDNLETVH
jgi:potassium channel